MIILAGLFIEIVKMVLKFILNHKWLKYTKQSVKENKTGKFDSLASEIIIKQLSWIE